MSGKKYIKVKERKHFKKPAWERVQGERQEKTEVNIFHPTYYHLSSPHRTPDKSEWVRKRWRKEESE